MFRGKNQSVGQSAGLANYCRDFARPGAIDTFNNYPSPDADNNMLDNVPVHLELRTFTPRFLMSSKTLGQLDTLFSPHPAPDLGWQEGGMLKYSECGGREAPGTHYSLGGSEVGMAGREGDRYGGPIISSLAPAWEVWCWGAHRRYQSTSSPRHSWPEHYTE